MSVEKIVDKILAEARGRAASITEQADRELQRLRSDLEHEEQQVGETSRKRTEDDAHEIVKRRVSSARLEARKRILRQKEMITDEVYAEAKRRLLALPDDKYLDLLKGLVAAYAVSGDEKIMLSAHDRDRLGDKIPRWEREIAGELKKKGIGGSISVSTETRDIEGGLILSRGRTEVNLSLDVILLEMKYLLEIEMSGSLFGD